MLSLRELSTMLSSHPSSTPYFSKFSFSICRERERERGRHHDQLVIFKFKTIVLNSSFPLETINYTYYSFSPTEKLSIVTANVMINKSKILSMLSLYASISNTNSWTQRVWSHVWTEYIVEKISYDHFSLTNNLEK